MRSRGSEERAAATGGRLKLCFVIQRFGLEVAGGAELHCRWLASRLARRHEVQVQTTCALDYLEWRNHYPPGRAEVDGIPVTRYPVRRMRSERSFGQISDHVFCEEHSPADEREWVVENGPECPELVDALATLPQVDLFIFYCYRYYQTFFGLPRVADRAILVPTAEEDRVLGLTVFQDLFTKPRGIVYLTPEERALLLENGADRRTPSVIVGSGVNIPAGWEGVDVRKRFDLPSNYLLYVGRIDRNKGVDRLLAYYRRLEAVWPAAPPLVLVGRSVLAIPAHAKIRALGFVSEEEKHALIAGCDVLIMPSPYESLSIIVLEAWALGRPVLANAACRVLLGQCTRSNGGLFYRGYAEFAAALRLLLERPGLRSKLGEAGRTYVRQEYDWDVVEQRMNGFLDEVRKRRAAS